MFVSPYDEQDYLTSENFQILERSDAEVAKNCVQRQWKRKLGVIAYYDKMLG